MGMTPLPPPLILHTVLGLGQHRSATVRSCPRHIQADRIVYSLRAARGPQVMISYQLACREFVQPPPPRECSPSLARALPATSPREVSVGQVLGRNLTSGSTGSKPPPAAAKPQGLRVRCTAARVPRSFAPRRSVLASRRASSSTAKPRVVYGHTRLPAPVCAPRHTGSW